jgi:hypothetical protein
MREAAATFLSLAPRFWWGHPAMSDCDTDERVMCLRQSCGGKDQPRRAQMKTNLTKDFIGNLKDFGVFWTRHIRGEWTGVHTKWWRRVAGASALDDDDDRIYGRRSHRDASVWSELEFVVMQRWLRNEHNSTWSWWMHPDKFRERDIKLSCMSQNRILVQATVHTQYLHCDGVTIFDASMLWITLLGWACQSARDDVFAGVMFLTTICSSFLRWFSPDNSVSWDFLNYLISYRIYLSTCVIRSTRMTVHKCKHHDTCRIWSTEWIVSRRKQYQITLS